jgi:hypothetical protein
MSLIVTLELWEADVYGEPVVINDQAAIKAILSEAKSGELKDVSGNGEFEEGGGATK